MCSPGRQVAEPGTGCRCLQARTLYVGAASGEHCRENAGLRAGWRSSRNRLEGTMKTFVGESGVQGTCRTCFEGLERVDICKGI